MSSIMASLVGSQTKESTVKFVSDEKGTNKENKQGEISKHVKHQTNINNYQLGMELSASQIEYEPLSDIKNTNIFSNTKKEAMSQQELDFNECEELSEQESQHLCADGSMEVQVDQCNTQQSEIKEPNFVNAFQLTEHKAAPEDFPRFKRFRSEPDEEVQSEKGMGSVVGVGQGKPPLPAKKEGEQPKEKKISIISNMCDYRVLSPFSNNSSKSTKNNEVEDLREENSVLRQQVCVLKESLSVVSSQQNRKIEEMEVYFRQAQLDLISQIEHLKSKLNLSSDSNNVRINLREAAHTSDYKQQQFFSEASLNSGRNAQNSQQLFELSQSTFRQVRPDQLLEEENKKGGEGGMAQILEVSELRLDEDCEDKLQADLLQRQADSHGAYSTETQERPAEGGDHQKIVYLTEDEPLKSEPPILEGKKEKKKQDVNCKCQIF